MVAGWALVVLCVGSPFFFLSFFFSLLLPLSLPSSFLMLERARETCYCFSLGKGVLGKSPVFRFQAGRLLLALRFITYLFASGTLFVLCFSTPANVALVLRGMAL